MQLSAGVATKKTKLFKNEEKASYKLLCRPPITPCCTLNTLLWYMAYYCPQLAKQLTMFAVTGKTVRAGRQTSVASREEEFCKRDSKYWNYAAIIH